MPSCLLLDLRGMFGTQFGAHCNPCLEIELDSTLPFFDMSLFFLRFVWCLQVGDKLSYSEPPNGSFSNFTISKIFSHFSPLWPLNLVPLGFHMDFSVQQVLYFNVVSGERVTQDAVKDMRWNTWSCPMAWHTYLDSKRGFGGS